MFFFNIAGVSEDETSGGVSVSTVDGVPVLSGEADSSSVEGDSFSVVGTSSSDIPGVVSSCSSSSPPGVILISSSGTFDSVPSS